MSNKELIDQLKSRAASYTDRGARYWFRKAADALEAAESPATVEWCVYESPTGVAWKVAPPTEREALAEAFMAGMGHDAIPLHLAGRLSNAFAHGRMLGHRQAREQAGRSAPQAEVAESPATVEWGVRIAGGRAGTSKVSDEAAAQVWVAECAGGHRYTREVVRRTAAGPWEVVAP